MSRGCFASPWTLYFNFSWPQGSAALGAWTGIVWHWSHHLFTCWKVCKIPDVTSCKVIKSFGCGKKKPPLLRFIFQQTDISGWGQHIGLYPTCRTSRTFLSGGWRRGKKENSTGKLRKQNTPIMFAEYYERAYWLRKDCSHVVASNCSNTVSLRVPTTIGKEDRIYIYTSPSTTHFSLLGVHKISNEIQNTFADLEDPYRGQASLNLVKLIWSSQ